MVVVQASEIRLVGGILAAPLYAPVVPAPFGAEALPFDLCLLHGVVPVPGTEHLPQILCDIPLVAVAYITDDIALQVGGAPLELRAGKHLADDILKPPESVCTDQTLGVECACKALALLLVPEYSQYSGMEVVVPVPRNSEWQCPPMAIGTTGTVPVALVPVRPSSRRYSLRSDTIRFIGMFYNREYILHRDVPYYTSPPASVSLSTTSPRFAGKPAAYRSLTG